MASLWISPLAVPEPVSCPPAGPRSRPVPAHRAAPRPAVRARPAAPSPAPMRAVYLRRRLVAAGVVCVAVLACWQAVAAFGRATVSDAATQWRSAPDVPVAVHDAAPGETLWDLAVAYGPDADPRRSLDVLVQLNGGSALVAGEPVKVPLAWVEAAR